MNENRWHKQTGKSMILTAKISTEISPCVKQPYIYSLLDFQFQQLFQILTDLSKCRLIVYSIYKWRIFYLLIQLCKVRHFICFYFSCSLQNTLRGTNKKLEQIKIFFSYNRVSATANGNNQGLINTPVCGQQYFGLIYCS